MKVGPFEIHEPVPELRETHAFATLKPWVDVGNVGSITLGWLETRFKAMELGHISKPGVFFDFTRYRPMAYFIENRREIAVPNVAIRYARMPLENDFLFLHLLEPHMFGEHFVDSILSLLVRFNVKRYFLIGSMYDIIPHTRPTAITGIASSNSLAGSFKNLNIKATTYQGPTTITSLLYRKGPEVGIETGTLVVHVPQYVQFEENIIGQYWLLSYLESLYKLPLGLESLKHKADEQLKQISAAVELNPELKQVIQELESRHDAQETADERNKTETNLSPEVERFMNEIDKRFGQN